MCLARSRQAYREGYPEVGEVVARIAQEEAGHVAAHAKLNGMLSPSTAEDIRRLLAGEQAANNKPARNFLDASSWDEARHARALRGLLHRYFPQGQ